VARYESIRLAHGSGGRLTAELIHDVFATTFDNAPLAALTDAAVLDNPGGRLAFATDSHTIKPWRFPGGDIGRLAVAGTVNDLVVMAAVPRYLSAAFILEEGFRLEDLEAVVRSMKRTADEAGVEVVTGDTKVVERGKGDGIFINTAGVGFIPPGRDVGPHRLTAGDVLLVNGTLGDHGLAVMAAREGLELGMTLESDVAPLGSLVETLLAAAPDVHFMRDATRGGLAAVANEMVASRPFGVRVWDARVPLNRDVAELSEMLGIDPLLAANEGKLVVALPADQAEAAVAALHDHELGREAAVIGDLVTRPAGMALVETPYGSRRVLEMPVEEQLPRIC
jgi:hydrogenase expression/formation protein HypE